MSIKEELDRRYMEALRAKDSRTTDVIRAVRAKVTEEEKKPDFKTGRGDALYAEVVQRYVKSLEKAVPEFEKGGEAGARIVAQYRFEIDYLSALLPKRLGVEETRALVREALQRLAVTDPKQAGRVMGDLMKGHRDELDSALTKTVIEEELAPR